nr:hypothetical protein [Candidatus Sigynarchaeum springense]
MQESDALSRAKRPFHDLGKRLLEDARAAAKNGKRTNLGDHLLVAKGLPDGKGGMVDLNFGALQGIQDPFDVVAITHEMHQLFTSMAQSGCMIHAASAHVTNNVRNVLITASLPSDLSMDSTQYDFKFDPALNTLQIAAGAGTWSARFYGGYGNFLSMLESFRTRFSMPPSSKLHLEIGEQLGIVATTSARGIDFGGGTILHENIAARLKLFLTEARRSDDLLIPYGTVLCLGFDGYIAHTAFESTAIDTSFRFDDLGLRTHVEIMNTIAMCDIPAREITTSYKNRYATEGYDVHTTEITFQNGAFVQLKVKGSHTEKRIEWGYKRIVKNENDDTLALSSITKAALTLAIDPAVFEDEHKYYKLDNYAGKFWNVLEIDPESKTLTKHNVRFDQWLVHHLLGEEYPTDTWGGKYLRGRAPINEQQLEQACAIAGIETDANGKIVQSLENDLKILRWFLLYAANAGNRLVDPSLPSQPASLQRWVALHRWYETGMTQAELLAMSKADFAAFLQTNLLAKIRVYEWMLEFGLSGAADGGFIQLPDVIGGHWTLIDA